jgi:hypothetical protein
MPFHITALNTLLLYVKLLLLLMIITDTQRRYIG